MQIDLRLLRQAQALAEHGNFTRAAEALNIAQPSLSRGIKDLEDRVGLPLFVRSRSGHEPTDFGRVFLQHAAELLAGVGELEREVALAKGLGTGELAVGLGPYVAELLAATSAARFVGAHPGVRLRMLINDPGLLARMLRTRSVDLAVAETSVLESDKDFETVTRLPPIPGFVIVRAGHPLAAAPPVGLASVLQYPFAQVVMLPPRLLKPLLETRQKAVAGRKEPMLPFPAIECPTLHLASKIVANTDAFTFATLGMVRAELELGLSVPVLQPPWLQAEWSIVRLRKRVMSPAMTAFAGKLAGVHAEVLREDGLLRKRWATSSGPAPRDPKRAEGRSKSGARVAPAAPPVGKKRQPLAPQEPMQ